MTFVDNVSVRTAQAMQNHMMNLLRQFLGVCSGLIPVAEKRHFESDYAADSHTWEMEIKEHRNIGRTAGEKVRDTERVIQKLVARNRRYTDSFMALLVTSATGKRPAQDDIDILRTALNQPIGSLTYQPMRHYSRESSRWPRPPYSPEQKPQIREAAEFLMSYLNLAEAHGAVHRACQGCQRLFVKGRGGKKFCSKECLKANWSYQRRKKDLLKNARWNRKKEGRR